LRTIAEKADRLIAIYVPQSHDICVAVAAEEQLEGTSAMAAVQEAHSHKGKVPEASKKGQGRTLLQ
jgi:hypothetical protein